MALTSELKSWNLSLVEGAAISKASLAGSPLQIQPEWDKGCGNMRVTVDREMEVEVDCRWTCGPASRAFHLSALVSLSPTSPPLHSVVQAAIFLHSSVPDCKPMRRR